MTSGDYLSLDIDLFQDADFLRDVSSVEGDDDVSLLNSDIISINSFDLSNFDENTSSLIFLGSPTERNSIDGSFIDSIDDLNSEHTSRNNDSIVSKLYNQPYIVYGAEIFPSILADAYNQGDIDQVQAIIAAYISEKCVFRTTNPTHTQEEYGTSSVIDFYSMVHAKCPDTILLVRGAKKIVAKNGYYLRVKLNMSGTMMDPTDACGVKGSITEIASPKLSKANHDAIRVAEALIKKQKKFIHAFFKGFMHMFVNELTHKIDSYDICLSLTSIRAFEG